MSKCFSFVLFFNHFRIFFSAVFMCMFMFIHSYNLSIPLLAGLSSNFLPFTFCSCFVLLLLSCLCHFPRKKQHTTSSVNDVPLIHFECILFSILGGFVVCICMSVGFHVFGHVYLFHSSRCWVFCRIVLWLHAVQHQQLK